MSNNQTYAPLWAEPIRHMRESILDAAKETAEQLESLGYQPWDDDACIGMDRIDGQPTIILELFSSETSLKLASFSCTIDEFLDETKDCYSSRDAGWGEDMIEDLETLKRKLEQRITRMRAEIDAER